MEGMDPNAAAEVSALEFIESATCGCDDEDGELVMVLTARKE